MSAIGSGGVGAYNTPAVHYFVPNNPAVARSLRQRLIKQRDEMLDHLRDAQDWSQFKSRTGQIRGIEIALEICAEVEKDMES